MPRTQLLFVVVKKEQMAYTNRLRTLTALASIIFYSSNRCLNTPTVSSRRTLSICGTVTPVTNQWSGSAQPYNTSGESARPSDRAVFNCPTALTGQTWTYNLSEQHHEIPHSQSPQRASRLHAEKQALQRQPHHSLPSPEGHLAGTGRVHHRYPGVRHRRGGAALNHSSVNGRPRPMAGVLIAGICTVLTAALPITLWELRVLNNLTPRLS